MSSVLSMPPVQPAGEQQRGQDPRTGLGFGNVGFQVDPQMAMAAAAPQAPPQSQYVAQSLGIGGLPKNPQLESTALGAYTDSQAEADLAALRHEIAMKHNDILQQLGYTDPTTGAFVPGTTEIDANRQKAELQRNQDLAREQNTQEMQRAGTLFSGWRGTSQARAEEPFVRGIADLGVSTPRTLHGLYEQASNLGQEFVVRQNQILAGASQRRAAEMAQQALIDALKASRMGGGGGGNFFPGSGGQVVNPSPNMFANFDPSVFSWITPDAAVTGGSGGFIPGGGYTAGTPSPVGGKRVAF